MEIKTSKILYIKLGKEGNWEKECIEKTQTLHLGYRETNHAHCLKKNWDAVKKEFIEKQKTTLGTATNHTRQVREFYEADNSVLWITFYGNQLWWCFSEPTVTLLSDSTKTRPVIGKWSNKDIFGNNLNVDKLSGKLLKVQGFRGTICKINELNYILQKINGKELPEIIEAKKAVLILEKNIGQLIKLLQWKDFEILVDLIFTRAGWQRVGTVGKTEKTLDLDLLSPVTNERSMVQIKSTSNLKEFKEYSEAFKNMHGYSKLFFVVHTPDISLKNVASTDTIKLLILEHITKLAINAGLVEWIINKSS